MGNVSNAFVSGERAISTGRMYIYMVLIGIVAMFVIGIHFMGDDDLDDNTKDIKKYTVPLLAILGIICIFIFYENRLVQKSNTYAKIRGAGNVVSFLSRN